MKTLFFSFLMAVCLALPLSSSASEEGRRKAQAYIVQGKKTYPTKATKTAAKSSKKNSHKVAKTKKSSPVKTAQYSAKRKQKTHANRVATKNSDGN